MGPVQMVIQHLKKFLSKVSRKPVGSEEHDENATSENLPPHVILQHLMKCDKKVEQVDITNAYVYEPVRTTPSW